MFVPRVSSSVSIGVMEMEGAAEGGTEIDRIGVKGLPSALAFFSSFSRL